MANTPPPSFQYLPRWPPPPPYLCYAQGMGNLHMELNEYRPWSQVFTVLPLQGALCQDVYPGYFE